MTKTSQPLWKSSISQRKTISIEEWGHLQCSPCQAVTGKIYRLKQHFLPSATSNWSVNCCKKYANCDPSRSPQQKEVNMEKHSYSPSLLYLNADWHLSKHCKLTIFSWASVPILSFFDQQEKFATSATFVTKLTLAAKAAFIRKSVCFEVFKILFGQLVDRMLQNKSLHECEAPPPAGECASGTHFWPYRWRMVPYLLS